MKEVFIIEITDSPDITRWSEFVYSHPYGNIFQTPEMAEVYKRTKNYEPITLVAVDSGDEMLAVLQAVVIKEMKSVLGSFSARSIIQGGPLLIEGEKGIEALKVLIGHYDKLAQKKALYTQIRTMWDTADVSNFFERIGYTYEDHLNILIDLRKPKNDLWSSLTKSRRRGVKNARKRNLIIEVMEDKKMIPVFYGLLRETYRGVKIPLADVSLFEAIYDILVPKNMARFFLVKHDGEYIGGRVVLLFNKTVYTWYRGSKPEFLKFYPNDLMGWDTIERYNGKGYHLLDFGGAGKPKENYGVRDFKMQFGGQLVNCGRFEKIYQPNKLKFSMKMFSMYRTIRGEHGYD